MPRTAVNFTIRAAAFRVPLPPASIRPKIGKRVFVGRILRVDGFRSVYRCVVSTRLKKKKNYLHEPIKDHRISFRARAQFRIRIRKRRNRHGNRPCIFSFLFFFLRLYISLYLSLVSFFVIRKKRDDERNIYIKGVPRFEFCAICVVKCCQRQKKRQRNSIIKNGTRKSNVFIVERYFKNKEGFRKSSSTHRAFILMDRLIEKIVAFGVRKIHE